MTTDKTPATLAVDVLAVIEDHVTYYEGLQRQARGEGNDHYADELDEESGTLNQLRLARSAVADLIEAATELRARLCLHGDWEDGCFYYNGYSAPELMAPMADVDAALARVKGESA